MTGPFEAAEDTHAAVANTVEPVPAAATRRDRPMCRNCGAPLTSKYCAECAQPAHVHRSLLALGHDILHAVFHFEGKFWRTLPALVLHPGQLTRRYIDGERAKFVSPMALFLFTVFAMFAVFSFVGSPTDVSATAGYGASRRAAMETNERKLAELRSRLAEPGLAPENRSALEREVAEVESWQAVTQAMSGGITVHGAAEDGATATRSAEADFPLLERPLRAGLQQLRANPHLLLYKLKTNGYKFSWALIPLSLPFMWLLFARHRDVRLYDHAVFVTYSITFMMLLAIVSSLLSTAGVGPDALEALWLIVPPVHLYRQLRGTYGLTRGGALVRLILLLIFAVLVLSLFVALLLLIGVAG